MSKNSQAFNEAIDTIAGGVAKLMAAVNGGESWSDSHGHVATTAMNCATSIWSQINAQMTVDVSAHRIELPQYVKDAIRDKLGITEPERPENAPAGPVPAEETASSPGL